MIGTFEWTLTERELQIIVVLAIIGAATIWKYSLKGVLWIVKKVKEYKESRDIGERLRG